MNSASDYVQGLIALWRAQQARELVAVDVVARARWVDGLVQHGRGVLEARRNPPALQRFRRLVSNDRAGFEARVRQRVDARLAALGEHAQHWLALFETEPDLLGPFDFLRAETVHTRLLAWILNGGQRRGTGLGTGPLKSFLELLGARGSAFAGGALACDLSRARVHPERSVAPYGRVDLWLEFPGYGDLVVEVKVDASEAHEQVLNYRKALERLRGHGKAIETAFLTVGGDTCMDEDAVLLSFRDVLHAWLPHAAGGSAESRYLRSYLKSVAVSLCDLAGHGAFREWHWIRQAATLDFITGETP